MMRDTIGCGLFFMAYDLGLRASTPPGKTRKEVPSSGVLVAAMGAGIGYWSISYPIDIVKTRIQSDCRHNPRYRKESISIEYK
jgi:solute carrier family 25 carnitine/acylcarnitine transporter 20/29